MEDTTGEGLSRGPGTYPSVDLGLPGYESYEEIGRGGFSVVYKAVQTDFGRTVAVKVIAGSADETTLMRFERECKTMGTLSDHPNIVTVFGNGRTDKGDLYIVMEFLGQGSLADRLALGNLPWEDVVDVGIRISDALQAAHDAGVLHRDVKPENIFVSNYGEAKLGDFGIARLEGGSATKSGVITASIAHAAPEILDGRRPSEASDVYSLGSTLYTLLAGAPAFTSATDESIVPMLARIAIEPVPDLRPVGVPASVCEVLEASMAKKLEHRIPSAANFAQRLRQAREAAHNGVSVATQPVVPILPTGEQPGTGWTGALGGAAATVAPQAPAPPWPTGGAAPPPGVVSGETYAPQQPNPAYLNTGQTPQGSPYVTGQVPSQGPTPGYPVAPQQVPMYPGYGATGSVAVEKQGGGAKVALVIILVLIVLGGLGAVGVAMSGKSSTTTTAAVATPSTTVKAGQVTTTKAGDPTSTAGGSAIVMNSLGLGDCFDHPDMAAVVDDEPDDQDVAVTQVPCDGAHDLQVVATEVYKASRSDPYPSDLGTQVGEICRSGFETFVGTSIDQVGDRYAAITVYPDETQWGDGKRNVVCAAYRIDGTKLLSTLQGAAS